MGNAAVVPSYAADGVIRAEPKLRLEPHDDRIDVMVDDTLFTTYHFRSGTKPILWPLIGPEGDRFSREYPMNAFAPGEEHDHKHHRSLWMTFGEVDHVDFWAEGDDKGLVEHVRIDTLTTSADATSCSIVAEHRWKPDASFKSTGDPLIRCLVKYTFYATTDARWIDCEYLMSNIKPDGKPILLGDTKEGMFGLRVPESMRADRAGGHIQTSLGLADAAAWGKPAEWVDYSGKLPTKTEPGSPAKTGGIAIMVHPTSFHADGLWHVRTYGLFAHNPIGIRHFIEGREGEYSPEIVKRSGGVELEADKPMHLFYRVLLHNESWTANQLDERYRAFAAAKSELNRSK